MKKKDQSKSRNDNIKPQRVWVGRYHEVRPFCACACGGGFYRVLLDDVSGEVQTRAGVKSSAAEEKRKKIEEALAERQQRERQLKQERRQARDAAKKNKGAEAGGSEAAGSSEAAPRRALDAAARRSLDEAQARLQMERARLVADHDLAVSLSAKENYGRQQHLGGGSVGASGYCYEHDVSDFDADQYVLPQGRGVPSSWGGRVSTPAAPAPAAPREFNATAEDFPTLDHRVLVSKLAQHL